MRSQILFSSLSWQPILLSGVDLHTKHVTCMCSFQAQDDDMCSHTEPLN